MTFVDLAILIILACFFLAKAAVAQGDFPPLPSNFPDAYPFPIRDYGVTGGDMIIISSTPYPNKPNLVQVCTVGTAAEFFGISSHEHRHVLITSCHCFMSGTLCTSVATDYSSVYVYAVVNGVQQVVYFGEITFAVPALDVALVIYEPKSTNSMVNPQRFYHNRFLNYAYFDPYRSIYSTMPPIATYFGMRIIGDHRSTVGAMDYYYYFTNFGWIDYKLRNPQLPEYYDGDSGALLFSPGDPNPLIYRIVGVLSQTPFKQNNVLRFAYWSDTCNAIEYPDRTVKRFTLCALDEQTATRLNFTVPRNPFPQTEIVAGIKRNEEIRLNYYTFILKAYASIPIASYKYLFLTQEKWDRLFLLPDQRYPQKHPRITCVSRRYDLNKLENLFGEKFAALYSIGRMVCNYPPDMIPKVKLNDISPAEVDLVGSLSVNISSPKDWLLAQGVNPDSLPSVDEEGSSAWFVPPSAGFFLLIVGCTIFVLLIAVCLKLYQRKHSISQTMTHMVEMH